ncbi:MAG: N-formylglutamate amidohydrolase [Robiginitomaculum sp.]|nr:MAG: N-formylglutamate amidohydrolase [Robiginitomaculum sp.]
MWKLNNQKNRANGSTGNKHALKIDKAEEHALRAFSPAYALTLPKTIETPLILASPHSGRLYPRGFLDQTSLSQTELRLSEDSYVDHIFHPLTKLGIPFLQALFPRCYVDVNRSATEWPPESISPPPHEISPRAKAGLGVIPTRIAQNLNIYKHPLLAKHIQARLDALYHPYHAALTTCIETTKAKIGNAVLLDCHSMPGLLATGQKRADIILGDQFGKTCHPDTIHILQTKLQSLGYAVIRNIPYAGGFVTAHYGQPDMAVEAIQIEINKDLYLNPLTLEPHADMAKICEDMQLAITHLAKTLQTTPIAAQ